MAPEIDLHIDELVLHGFAQADRGRIGAAVERELARLFGERGVPPSLAGRGYAAQLSGGSFHLAPHAAAESIGIHVATAVYKALSQSEMRQRDGHLR